MDGGDDREFLAGALGDSLLAALDRSGYVRSMDRGRLRPIQDLEESAAAALDAVRRRLDREPRDWGRHHELAVEFHRRNATARANATIGEDVAAQIDPDFVLDPRLLTVFLNRSGCMSIEVSPELIAEAERGEVDDAPFLQAAERSLPYAWSVMSRVAGELGPALAAGRAFSDDATPPTEEQRGQLLRALASSSIRAAMERRFGVRFAFQNCHRIAAFPATDMERENREFCSSRAQVLNQTPELRHC